MRSPFHRRLSSEVKLHTDDNGICTLDLNKPPVNSLGLEFMETIIEAFDQVEKEKQYKGMVLTSTNKSIFCAGLDLQEMYQPDEKRLRAFWHTLQELWLRLYLFKVPTGAAIAGHSPAGGALMATCCDFRAMVASEKFTIGLNEAKFGLVAPFWFMDSFRNTIGQRETEYALLNGKLYSVSEAYKIGLIDKIVENQEEAVSECKKEILQQLQCVPMSWYLSKLQLRENFTEKLRAKRAEDTQNFVDLVMTDKMQNLLGKYLSSLKKNK